MTDVKSMSDFIDGDEGFRQRKRPDAWDREVENVRQRNMLHLSYLEASLCAIFNCLERRNICKDVVTEASLTGDINIDEFYAQHKKEDKERMAKIIIGLSEDEKEILLNLLKGKV